MRSRTSDVHGARQRLSEVISGTTSASRWPGRIASSSGCRSRGGGRRLQPLDAVAPVGHAGVGDRPGERRVAQPVRQVVVEHRDLLGLRRDDEVAGAQRRRDRLRHVAHVALLRRRAVDRPQHGDEREPDEPEPPAVGEARRRRAAGTAGRPPRGSGPPRRARPASRPRRARSSATAITEQAPSRGRAGPARAQQRHDARAGGQQDGDLGDLAEDAARAPRRARRATAPCDHGAPVWAAW